MKVQVITGLHGCRGARFFQQAEACCFSFQLFFSFLWFPVSIRRNMVQFALAEHPAIEYNVKVHFAAICRAPLLLLERTESQ